MPTPEAGKNKRVSFSQASRKIPAGVFETSAFSVPDDIDTVKITMTRESWPVVSDAYLIKVQIFISYDAGVTWFLLMGFTAPGGVMQDKLHREMVQSTVKRHIKPGVGRMVKAGVDCKAALNTSIKVEGW